jgi:hypothetical protein
VSGIERISMTTTAARANAGFFLMARRFDFPIEPMTLGNMRELGVRSLFVSCWQSPPPGGAQRRSVAR